MAGAITQRDVFYAGPVVNECESTDRRVAVAVFRRRDCTRGGVIKRLETKGRVGVAGVVVMQRAAADGRVTEADCVVIERIPTHGRVGVAGDVTIQRGDTRGRVAAADCVVVERIVANSGVEVASSVASQGVRTDGRI